eukprot:6469036-Amphidinium_carterae.1
MGAHDADDATGTPQSEIPQALDVMSGLRAPIARALSWCGWQVQAIDITRSKHHDLSAVSLQHRLLDEATYQAAVFVAMDCTTFSRAREQPLPGGPRPLRSDHEPLGLSTLQQPEASRVEQANQLASFTARLAVTAHDAGAGVVLENPRHAYYWHLPEIAA